MIEWNVLKQVDASSGEILTSDRLRLQSIQLAKCLQAKGIIEGDVISICSENRCEYPVVFFAAVYLGATVAPLNVTYNERKYYIHIHL